MKLSYDLCVIYYMFLLRSLLHSCVNYNPRCLWKVKRVRK